MATNTFIPLKNDAAPSGADLSLLLVFEAVYAERQISRAAQRLGLAQPTVSNALGRLRRLTGDALFDLFSRTRAIRRSIIEQGQDDDRPDFGRADH